MGPHLARLCPEAILGEFRVTAFLIDDHDERACLAVEQAVDGGPVRLALLHAHLAALDHQRAAGTLFAAVRVLQGGVGMDGAGKAQRRDGGEHRDNAS
jgi:predicted ATPase